MPSVPRDALPAAESQKHTAAARHSLHACQERTGCMHGPEQGPSLAERLWVLVPSCAWQARAAVDACIAAAPAAEVAPARQAAVEAAIAASALHAPPAEHARLSISCMAVNC
jgi:hypothetical protein